MSGEIEIGGMHWVRDRRDRWISDEDDAALVTEAAMLDEIERLRAAGDALAYFIGAWFEERIPDEPSHLVAAWQEARQ